MVYVYGLFTNGTASNFIEANNRLNQDISIANQIWRGCINFVSGGVFDYTSRVVNAGSVAYTQALADGSPVVSIIEEFKRYNRSVNTSDKVNNAIYLVYLSGPTFSGGEVGVGGIKVEEFRSGTNAIITGQMAMTDRAKGLDTFAHEAGHILFNQYNPVTGSWNDDDPSGPYVDQRGIIDRFIIMILIISWRLLAILVLIFQVLQSQLLNVQKLKTVE
ncbi:hypothetical protein ACFQDF_33935 [Ectobacillus funiculus]